VLIGLQQGSVISSGQPVLSKGYPIQVSLSHQLSQHFGALRITATWPTFATSWFSGNYTLLFFSGFVHPSNQKHLSNREVLLRWLSLLRRLLIRVLSLIRFSTKNGPQDGRRVRKVAPAHSLPLCASRRISPRLASRLNVLMASPLPPHLLMEPFSKLQWWWVSLRVYARALLRLVQVEVGCPSISCRAGCLPLTLRC